MTGSLMFSMMETRPDIAYATSLVSRFAKNPSHQHTEADKLFFRYLKGSRNRGITYGGDEELHVVGYSDSDWAGDKESRKSTSGFIFMLHRGPVSWRSKRQSTVALTSTEAEYIALTLAAKEATWLRLLLTELGLLKPGEQHALIKISEQNTCAQAIHQDLEDNACGGEERPTTEPATSITIPTEPATSITIPLKDDNQGSISLAHNPVLHTRTKHIDIQHHYIRNEVAAQRIELLYVPISDDCRWPREGPDTRQIPWVYRSNEDDLRASEYSRVE